MRIALVSTLYEAYLDSYYGRNPGLAERPYEQQREQILDDRFGWVQSLVRAVGRTGHETEVIIANCAQSQKMWLKERQIKEVPEFEIVLRQIEEFQPDIVWVVAAARFFAVENLRKLRDLAPSLVLWLAAATSKNTDLSPVDCVLTSHLNLADDFRRRGLQSEVLLPAFDDRIAQDLAGTEKTVPVSFVGSLSGAHLRRMIILSELIRSNEIEIWANLPRYFDRRLFNPDFLRSSVRIRKARDLHPAVWGMEMYRTLARSHATVNIHVDVAENHAGNMRLFEATGSGTLVLTERSVNIGELFVPGVEIETYADVSELKAKIAHFKNNPKAAAEIALKGQQRTLQTHSISARVPKFLSILEKHAL